MKSLHILIFVKSALKDLGFSHVWKNHGPFDHFSLFYSIKLKLKEYYISFWEKSLKSDDGKLRTYRLFKSEFGTETYLDVINDKNVRKNICCFRICAWCTSPSYREGKVHRHKNRRPFMCRL